MEQHFNQEEDFELFLKESTDDFKMYPSRKIWYSLYNGLHPAKKWPSLAVSLFLISVMLYLGVSNNNNIYKKIDNKQKIASIIADHYFEDIPTFTFPKQLHKAAVDNAKKSYLTIVSTSPEAFIIEDVPIVTLLAPEILPLAITVTANNANELQATGSEVFDNSQSKTTKAIIASQNTSNNSSFNNNDNNDDNNDEQAKLVSSATQKEFADKPIVKTAVNNFKDDNYTLDTKRWVENFAFENKKSRSSFKRKSSIQYYITPSVGFRWLVKKNDVNAVNASTQAIINVGQTQANININDQVTQRFAANFEAGVALHYSLSNRMRLKYGLQFNYTNYIIHATELPHSTQTQIAVFNSSTNSFSQIDRSSNFVNTINSNKSTLNNSTTQLAIPVGADYKIAGKGKLKWYAGATIQPTFIIGASTFAISADVKNYIQEEALLRRFNANAGLETFVTYNTGNGIILNLGPQVRYQLRSSYVKEYIYSEKLYNFGLKIGLSKSF